MVREQLAEQELCHYLFSKYIVLFIDLVECGCRKLQKVFVFITYPACQHHGSSGRSLNSRFSAIRSALLASEFLICFLFVLCAFAPLLMALLWAASAIHSITGTHLLPAPAFVKSLANFEKITRFVSALLTISHFISSNQQQSRTRHASSRGIATETRNLDASRHVF